MVGCQGFGIGGRTLAVVRGGRWSGFCPGGQDFGQGSGWWVVRFFLAWGAGLWPWFGVVGGRGFGLGGRTLAVVRGGRWSGFWHGGQDCGQGSGWWVRVLAWGPGLWPWFGVVGGRGFGLGGRTLVRVRGGGLSGFFWHGGQDFGQGSGW